MKTRLKNAIAKVRKAIVGAAAVALVGVLHKYNITIPVDALQIILDSALVSGIVYVVPNSKPIMEDSNE